MTQIFNEDGELVPVTVLQAGPCVVTQVKTVENDGYMKQFRLASATSEKKEMLNKPQKATLTKAGVAVKRFVKEFKFENAAEYE